MVWRHLLYKDTRVRLGWKVSGLASLKEKSQIFKEAKRLDQAQVVNKKLWDSQLIKLYCLVILL